MNLIARKIKTVTEYNKNGDILHKKESIGNNCIEYWNKYDEYGRLIYFKNNKGLEILTEYHENGYHTTKTSDGSESLYDENNRIIYHIINRVKTEFDYFDDGSIGYHVINLDTGEESWTVYDSRGVEVYFKKGE